MRESRGIHGIGPLTGMALASAAAGMLVEEELFIQPPPVRRKYQGRYGPFWGRPEKPRTKKIKAAQRAARKARRRGEAR